ncbi:YceI family protein [Peribacillus castrilensis]|jgi:polyisoprenoid-binding protein YceI|uniref:YceI family protein n=3 Tax=Peribacillus TaxID=2675229 RepID=A0AAJ1QTA7_9BACI|nr:MULTISPECIES: YceI family protein [Bacillaceae]MCD1163945.1 YceI family protein [Peribacillus castrilensis]QYF83400.1 YceI family protein [Brevibacterium sp. PAMC21349]MCF7625126.1 YceI family protein [Peribacillus frigoritolerans]MCP1155661.1 YceI family protein [Peribacillus frigoritolerans]MCT1391745.1 YceI family protein [Peribacillus frigoritolerans]
MTNTKWIVDPTHSAIEFSVKHMMIAKVKGSFNKFEASILANPSDLTTAEIDFTVDVASIDTRNADRDNHLRSADFFDVEKNPTLTFKSTKIVKTDEDEYDVTGNVTLNGVTQEETFNITFEGQGKDPWGNEKAGFSGKGKVKRSDYGLTYNAALETGGVLIGDQITLTIEIEAAKEA